MGKKEERRGENRRNLLGEHGVEKTVPWLVRAIITY